MSASLTATGRDFHAWFAPRGFPSSFPVFSCVQKLWADVLASLRSKVRGVCDAFSAILVHVCGSCDICGLLSVCGGTVDDSESDWWRFFFFLPVVWLKKRENCPALLLLLHFPFSYFLLLLYLLCSMSYSWIFPIFLFVSVFFFFVLFFLTLSP